MLDLRVTGVDTHFSCYSERYDAVNSSAVHYDQRNIYVNPAQSSNYMHVGLYGVYCPESKTTRSTWIDIGYKYIMPT